MSTTIALCSKVAIFEALCRVARDGDRCPDNESLKRMLIAMNCPRGPGPSKMVSKLAHEGHIKVLVYAKNYRVVTILTGPDMGFSTARYGSKGSRPHTVVRRMGFNLSPPAPLPAFADCPKVMPQEPEARRKLKARPHHRGAYSRRGEPPKREPPLPVARSDWLKPLTREQLMGRR